MAFENINFLGTGQFFRAKKDMLFFHEPETTFFGSPKSGAPMPSLVKAGEIMVPFSFIVPGKTLTYDGYRPRNYLYNQYRMYYPLPEDKDALNFNIFDFIEPVNISEVSNTRPIPGTVVKDDARFDVVTNEVLRYTVAAPWAQHKNWSSGNMIGDYARNDDGTTGAPGTLSPADELTLDPQANVAKGDSVTPRWEVIKLYAPVFDSITVPQSMMPKKGDVLTGFITNDPANGYRPGIIWEVSLPAPEGNSTALRTYQIIYPLDYLRRLGDNEQPSTQTTNQPVNGDTATPLTNDLPTIAKSEPTKEIDPSLLMVVGGIILLLLLIK